MPFTNIIFANEADARTYFLSPSSQALFMDPTSPIFYVKSTDSFGSPTFEKYSFQRIEEPAAPLANETPLTRADLESLRTEILSLIKSQPQGGNAHDEQQSVDTTLSATTNN